MIKSIFWFSCISRLSGAVPAMQVLYFDLLLLSRAGPFGRLCDASWQKASAATGGTSCAPGEGEERNILIWTIYFPKRMQVFCTEITNSRHRKSGSFLEHLMIHGNIGFTNHNTFISWSDSDMDNSELQMNEAIGLWLSPILVDLGHLVDSTLQIWWFNVESGWIWLWIWKKMKSCPAGRLDWIMDFKEAGIFTTMHQVV